MSFYILFIHKAHLVPFDDIFGCLAYPALEKYIFTQREEQDFEPIYEKINKMLERISKEDFKKEPKICGNLDGCTFCPYIYQCDDHK